VPVAADEASSRLGLDLSQNRKSLGYWTRRHNHANQDLEQSDSNPLSRVCAVEEDGSVDTVAGDLEKKVTSYEPQVRSSRIIGGRHCKYRGKLTF
jgi:hypothetical protein